MDDIDSSYHRSDQEDQTPDKMSRSESEEQEEEQKQSSEESSEEEEYDSEVEESESSEDEREERRKNAKKHKKLKGMDPIYDSGSGAESIRKNKNDDFSEDDEKPASVLDKIGSFLFFGCGGSKDKKNSNGPCE